MFKAAKLEYSEDVFKVCPNAPKFIDVKFLK